MNKNEIRKQVDESNHEARRNKTMIVFNLKMNKENNDREQIVVIIENMGVRVREEETCGEKDEEGRRRDHQTNNCGVSQ